MKIRTSFVSNSSSSSFIVHCINNGNAKFRGIIKTINVQKNEGNPDYSYKLLEEKDMDSIRASYGNNIAEQVRSLIKNGKEVYYISISQHDIELLDQLESLFKNGNILLACEDDETFIL